MVKRFFFVYLFCNSCIISFAQIDSTFVDSKYLDDQFYIGLNHNSLLSQPMDFEQNGLSGGLVIGYIRDLPVNKNRNIGFGLGVGYNYNTYIQNMKISESDGELVYEIIPSQYEYQTNRFTTQLIEVPIEFRWRSSTATKHSFWRIYAGMKLGYIIKSNAVYEDVDENIKVKNIEDFDKFQYGLTMSVGYSSLNIHLYYGLNSLFKDAYLNGESIDLSQLSVGLIFYIL